MVTRRRLSFMSSGVWSWPHISCQPGEFVSMGWIYMGPFIVFVRTYHLPYDKEVLS